MRTIRVTAVFLSFSVDTYAAEGSSGISLPSAQVGQVVGALLFVTCLIFFFAWLAKKLGAIHLASGQRIKHVATMAVGHREKVVLVDIEGKKILLGVAPGRVACVHVFDSESEASEKITAYSDVVGEGETAVSVGDKADLGNVTFMGKKDFSSYIKELLKNNRTSQ